MFTCYEDMCDRIQCPIASLTHRITVNVESDDQITLTRGQSGHFDVYVGFSPAFMCNRTGYKNPVEKCSVVLTIATDLMSKDQTCLGGTKFPQVVLGQSDDLAPQDLVSCGVKITTENWFKDFELPFTAFVDGLSYKSSLTRTIFVKKDIYIGTTMLYSEIIKTVRVSRKYHL